MKQSASYEYRTFPMLQFSVMGTLADFFEVNHEIFFFGYGLVFFVLGFAIILQVRKSSRLDLARSLRWLAAFGITHAFNEWGDLFIPIQAQYLSFTTVRVLYTLHFLLLAVSFACLFEFGAAVLRPLGRAESLRGFSVILLAAWLFVVFVVLLPRMLDHQLWRHTAVALARYFIGFPGGMLAAYGLRMHTFQRIKPLNVPQIVRMLQISGTSLGIYAILSGLIVPAVNFFPGNWLNSAVFTQFVGVPPWIFRSLVGLVTAVTIIRALEIFDLETERRIEELEQQQIIASEQERLARELHDGALQKVYTAGLLVESACRLAEPESEVKARMEKALLVLNDAVVDFRRNLAELHAGSQTTTEFVPELLEKIIADPRYNLMMNISLHTNLLESKSLSTSRSGHLSAIVNEALSNIVRHAQAENVEISIESTGENLRVVIKDDGIGIPENPKVGYGLRNIRDRARLLNGMIHFSGQKGTTVTLEMPWID
jgi:signal transduction histidine kinase